MRIALGEPEHSQGGLLMIKLRKFRLVYACLNLLGGLARLAAALIDMAFNYFHLHDGQVVHQVRA